MGKIQRLNIVYVEDFMPADLEDGKLYISEKYEIAIHLCACGCGKKSVTPIGEGEWCLTKGEDGVTLWPSVGNFIWENPYHAHYLIINSKIEWC